MPKRTGIYMLLPFILHCTTYSRSGISDPDELTHSIPYTLVKNLYFYSIFWKLIAYLNFLDLWGIFS